MHPNDVSDVVLESLSLTLTRFHILFCCFHCRLWTSKCELVYSRIGYWYLCSQFVLSSFIDPLGSLDTLLQIFQLWVKLLPLSLSQSVGVSPKNIKKPIIKRSKNWSRPLRVLWQNFEILDLDILLSWDFRSMV